MQIQSSSIQAPSATTTVPHAGDPGAPGVVPAMLGNGAGSVAAHSACTAPYIGAAAAVAQAFAVAAAADGPQSMAAVGAFGTGRATPVGGGPSRNNDPVITFTSDSGLTVPGGLQARNFSSDVILRPSQFIDPGIGRGLFISVTVGRPAGIITDLIYFFELIKRHRELHFMIFETFAEASLHYEIHFNLGLVRFAEHLATPLDLLVPGAEGNPIAVSSTATTPAIPRVPVVGPRPGPPDANTRDVEGDPAPPSPSPLGQAAPQPLGSQQVDEVIEVTSSDEMSEDGDSSSSDEDADGDVEFLDDSDLPSNLPKYPRPANSAPAPSTVNTQGPSSASTRATTRPATRSATRATPVAQSAAAAPSLAPAAPSAPAPVLAPAPIISQKAAPSPAPATRAMGNHVILGPSGFTPVVTKQPLGRNADPSRNMPGDQYPELVPNPFNTTPSPPPANFRGRVITFVPDSEAPVSSKKRTTRPTEASSSANAGGDGDAMARKRRRDAVEASFAHPQPTASSLGGTYSTFSINEPAAGPSAAGPSQSQGQINPNRSESPTDWGLPEWTAAQLDTLKGKAATALAPQSATVPQPATVPKVKKSKGKGKNTRKGE